MFDSNMFESGMEILQIISRGRGEARFVGGSVRNLLLAKAGVEVPPSDVDIATTLTPDETTKLFESHGIRVIPTGIDFGTVTIVYKQQNYEITTLRADIETDGRHAEVRYTKDWKEDASRRDFTFNALYMDEDGEITDFFNGQEDLKNGIVRFIGNAEERIKEDYLRILRMFRFHAYYGSGNILQSQLDTCKNLRDGLNIISGERIRAEMLKLLSSPNQQSAQHALEQMVTTGVFRQISGIDEKHYRMPRFSRLYTLTNEPNPIVSLATILCSKIPEEEIETFAARWRLSNKELRFFFRLRESMKIDYADDYQIRNSARINGKDEFHDHIILNYGKSRVTEEQGRELIKFATSFAVPDFPLKSADLMANGIKPGKQMGEILRRAEEIWERSNYTSTKEDLLKQVIAS